MKSEKFVEYPLQLKLLDSCEIIKFSLFVINFIVI